MNMHNTRLNSAEIGQLYTTYIADTMQKCVLSYFNSKVADGDIRSLILLSLSKLDKNIDTIKSIFISLNHPIPVGFSNEDVNVNAKRLFSDVFILQYIKHTIRFALINHSFALSVVCREDVRSFFHDCIDTYQEIAVKSQSILLAKGIHARTPSISTPGEVEFVNDDSYLSGFFSEILGKERPLNAIEMTHLFANIETNALGSALIKGFSIVAQSKDVQKYLLKGKEIAEKQIRVLGNLLIKEDITEPVMWDTEVIESKEAPFSDKLMMFHVTALIAYSIGVYGLAVANSMRSDVSAAFANLTIDVAQDAKEGAELMIKKGWLEKMPGNMNYKELVKS